MLSVAPNKMPNVFKWFIIVGVLEIWLQKYFLFLISAIPKKDEIR